MPKIALLSVSDKSGIETFARELVQRHGYKILSTGGTARALEQAGIPITEVGAYTGFPEMMEGRVKTLHPKIHGGLLARRDKPEHLESASEHGIDMIDLVVVNLYPFEATVAREGVTLEEAIENIDIGGPSMLRSAAKNHEAVTVVCDPADYGRVMQAMADADDAGTGRLRKELALKVFQKTAAYDHAIQGYLSGCLDDDGARDEILPETFSVQFPKSQNLRYGENPHQQAALYGDFHEGFEKLQGKELSYNNIIDIAAATQLIQEFDRPTVGILKHTNPCGVASAATLLEAWNQAFATDRQAPFGGILVMNRPLDGAVAEVIREIFCEVIIAPGFEADALDIFSKKKNLRLMIQKPGIGKDRGLEIKSVPGGVLVQDQDNRPIDPSAFKVVTDRQPTDEEWAALLFGWKVVRHVKSNAIVYAGAERTLGVGAGQMSRVDSSKLAVWKAAEAGLSLSGSAICSDAFFPFPDGLVAAAEAGATAAIQPGGSIRDEAVIEAADSRGMTMVFTGMRHFRHG